MSNVLVEPVGRTLQMGVQPSATATPTTAGPTTAAGGDVDRSADVSTPTEGERKGFPLHDDEYFGDEGALAEGDEGEAEEQQWIPMSWMRRFVVRNFACHLCRRMPHDPVLIVDASRVACRECSQRDGEDAVEGPPFLTRAITDLQGALVAARNARRPDATPLAASKSLGAAASGGGYVDVTNLEAAVGRMSVRRAAAVAPPALTPAQAAEITSHEVAERVALMTDQEAQVAEICKRHANRVRKARGGSSRVLKSEADERYEAGEYAASVELYSRAIAVNDGTVRLQGVHGNRSAAYFMTGQFTDCIDDCLRAVEMDAANAVHVAKMMLRATKAAMQLADTDRALKFLQRLRDLGGTSFTADTQNELTRVEKANGILKEVATMQPAAAEERLRMLATDFPEAAAFRLRHASHLIDMGRYRDARQQIDRVARTGDAAQLMARAMYSSGFEEFAAAREVLAQHPAHAGCKALLDYLGRLDGHKQHGNDLFSTKRFAEAIDAYSEGIKLEASGSPRLLRVLYCNRAAAYKEIGKYKEGVEDCTKALEFDPKFAKAYARRGRCLFQLDAFRGAVRDFKSSLELEPRDTAIQSELRMAEKQVQDRTELEKDLYAVLAVARTANNDEIRSSFRRLSLQYHPDKTVGLLPDLRAEAERKFKIVNDAYTTLTDATARRQYDLSQQMHAMRRATAGTGMGGAGPGAFGSAFTGMGGMYGAAAGGAAGAGAANRGNYWRQ